MIFDPVLDGAILVVDKPWQLGILLPVVVVVSLGMNEEAK